MKERVGHKSRMTFRSFLLENFQNSSGRVCIGGFWIPQCDLQKIYQVKKIEWEVLCSFAKLVKSMSHRWAHRATDCSINRADLYEEAVFSVCRAICYYVGKKKSGKSVSFSTYCYHAVNRRLITICSRSKAIGPWSNEAIKLYNLYLRTKSQINGPANFAQIVRKMKIGERDRRKLQNLLVCVFNERSISSDEENKARQFDSTSSGLRFAGIDGSVSWSVVGHNDRALVLSGINRVDLELDLQTAIENIEFSDFEIMVLNEFLTNNKSGWMTRVATENTNPKTDKPYSRMAVSLAWKRIREKIASFYSREAA